uniref:Polycystin cation channel PKD1/PKD2 domain-containing protein n=1 Tax=Hanusia phi TaxID=3032 RepID=A0A7S0E940_9CRYP
MARTARGSGRTTVMMAATGAAGASKARDSEASDRRGDRDEIESGGRKGGEQGHGGLFAEQEKERALAAEEVKVRARRKLMEMLAFIVFLVLFTCNALMQRPVEASHDFSKEFTAATLEGASFSSTTYFKGIRDVGTVDDFWTWMVECPMQYLYIDRSYNGSLFGPDFQGTTWRVNGNNVIVQRPRLRQVRVEPQTCKIPKRMKAKVGYGDQQTCIPKVQDAEIDKTTWWALELNSSFVMVQRPVPFYSASQLSSSSFTSRASGSPLSYDGGGFIQDFPLNMSNAQFVGFLQALRAGGWTDSRTRAVFFDYVVYNVALNLFLSTRLLFEFLPYGFVRSSNSIRVMRFGYVRLSDLSLLVLDIFVYVTVFIWLGLLILRVSKERRRVLRDVWFCIDLVNIVIFMITLGYKVQYYNMVKDFIGGYPDPSVAGSPSQESPVFGSGRGETGFLQRYMDFDALGWYSNQITNWTGFNALITWLKFLGYLQYLNPAVSRLILTLARSAKDVTIFTILLAIALWAFALALYVSFGSEMDEFKSVNLAYINVCKSLVQGLDFDKIRQVNVFLGPLLFLLFQFICFFFLLNMFIAIIMESYEIVREQEEKVTLMSYLREKLSHVIGTTVHPVPVHIDNNDSDKGAGREEANLEDNGKVQQNVQKIQADIELVLASLVDFRKEMRSLGKKVHQITETGGKGHYPTNFLE